jgi:hypothetical protein
MFLQAPVIGLAKAMTLNGPPYEPKRGQRHGSRARSMHFQGFTARSLLFLASSAHVKVGPRCPFVTQLRCESNLVHLARVACTRSISLFLIKKTAARDTGFALLTYFTLKSNPTAFFAVRLSFPVQRSSSAVSSLTTTIHSLASTTHDI